MDHCARNATAWANHVGHNHLVSEFQVRLATPDDAAGIAQVKIEGWRWAYKGFLDRKVLEGLDLNRETQRWRERLLNWSPDEPIWVACQGRSILGFLAAGANRYPEVPCDAELQAIYVLPSANRRGVGRALLTEGVAWLLQHGYKNMAVFVFRDNAVGTSFYKSLGAELYDSGEFEVAGKKYPDQSYRWPSLVGLQDRLTSGR
jgi:ribosomal protein S18 acetylase RimI-like enzyme